MSEQEKQPRAKQGTGARSGQNLVILAIVVVGLIALGVGAMASSGGSTSYACMRISQSGGTVSVTTSGLVHLQTGSYYISCNEGSSLPTASTSFSCLTITPKSTVSPYPGGQTTYVYYLAAPASSVSVQGNGANATEVLQPANVALSINCG